MLTLSVSAGKSGFSLELFRKTSKLSPFDLTDFEISKSIGQFDENELSVINLTTLVRPSIGIVSPGKYIVSLTIGSGRGKQNYNLMFSPSTNFAWTQCKPCHPCFEQSTPIFDPQLSSTFRTISCADSLCRPPLFNCVDGKCIYRVQRATGIGSYSGYLARESVAIENSQPIPMIPFGCTQSSEINIGSNMIHGVMGMNMNPSSFAMQLAGHQSGAFSYCLVLITRRDSRSLLRFGTDINQPRQYQTTPILRYDDHMYHVELQDVSINREKMGFAAGTFNRSPTNAGFIVDAGNSPNRMIAQAYVRVTTYIRNYFQRFGAPPVNIPNVSSPCFELVESIKNQLPIMTLHFPRGVNYEIRSEHLFYKSSLRDGRIVVCLALVSDPSFTTLGSVTSQYMDGIRY